MADRNDAGAAARLSVAAERRGSGKSPGTRSNPAPPADSYYAPRFEGAAPIADPAAIPEVQRTEYVRQRLSRTGADFGAIVNRTLRSSLPPDWDGEALASNRQIRYPTDNWPRR